MASIRHALRGNAGSQPAESIRILIPVAGNDSEARLLDYVSKIAHKKQAFITLIYVVEVEQALPLDADLPEAVTHGERVLREAQNTIQQALGNRSCSIQTDLLQARSAGAAIVDEVGIQDADLIVMSAQVTKRMGKRTYGETTDTVLRNAPCEVIILRGPIAPSILNEMHMETEAE